MRSNGIVPQHEQKSGGLGRTSNKPSMMANGATAENA